MSDEPGFQLTRTNADLSLTSSQARSGLVARGRRDAAALAVHSDSVRQFLLSEARRLAEQGDARMQYELGNMYAERYQRAPSGGLEEDYAEAVRWYKQAAERGHPNASHSLSHFSYCPGGPPEGPGWRLRAIAAEMLAMGLTVPGDFAEAASRWRKAAELGDAQAQFNLGNICYCGQGMEQDLAEAARWYRRSAELGNGRAQLILGDMLINASGDAQPTDNSLRLEGALWLRMAHAQGIGPVWMYFEFMDEPPALQPGRPDDL